MRTHLNMESLSAQSQGLSPVARRWLASFALAAVSLGSSGCETDDPCARREAACVDVVLIGKKDDGAGNPIAYRGLKVSIFAPNWPRPAASPPDDTCETSMVAGKSVRRVFGRELGPVGSTLVSGDVPELTRKESYSPTIQTKLTFMLPAEFNALPDSNLDEELFKIADDDERIAKLKALRESDPRSLRILVTQAGQSQSAWDSRCEESVFSAGEWLMKHYYRVGKNQHAAVFAVLDGATTSNP